MYVYNVAATFLIQISHISFYVNPSYFLFMVGRWESEKAVLNVLQVCAGRYGF